MIDQVHFSSLQTIWETPSDLFDTLHNRFYFNRDVAASKSNAKTSAYYDEERDALSIDWQGRCFMNPPYGRQIRHWVRKADHEVRCGNVPIVVGLVPARTDTIWFQKFCMPHLHRFVLSRLYFEIDGERVKDKHGRDMPAPFPSALVYFGL